MSSKICRQVLMTTAIFAFSPLCIGQNRPTDSVSHRTGSSRFSVGYNLNQFQHDFGIGLNVTSPYFIHNRIAIRVSGNLQWLQSIDASSSTSVWNRYSTYKAGITVLSGRLSKSVRVYSEGGLVLVMPSRNFSATKTITGGYGLFGFEFVMSRRFFYFIELGGMGTGAVAERSLYRPVYSNGFTTSVGFRISL